MELMLEFPISIFAAYCFFRYICRVKHKVMATTEHLYLELPKDDLSFVKKLASKMGWRLFSKPQAGIEQALEDIEAGRVYEAKDADDMMKQILG